MNRRSWFKDLAIKAAGLTAFCAVAPAVQAEAAPEPGPDVYLTAKAEYERGLATFEEVRAESRALLGDDSGDSGYYSPNGVTVHRAEHGADMGTVTFEAMAEDCRARGCWIERHEPTAWGIIYSHKTEPWYYHKTEPWMPGDPGYQDVDFTDPDHLARVDAWRRSLHEQTGTTEHAAYYSGYLFGAAVSGPAMRLTRLT